MPKPLPPDDAARLLREAGDQLNALVKKAQHILATCIVPDSGISDRAVIGDLFGLLDGPEQRRAQANWAAAVAKAEGRVLVLTPKQDRN